MSSCTSTCHSPGRSDTADEPAHRVAAPQRRSAGGNPGRPATRTLAGRRAPPTARRPAARAASREGGAPNRAGHPVRPQVEWLIAPVQCRAPRPGWVWIARGEQPRPSAVTRSWVTSAFAPAERKNTRAAAVSHVRRRRGARRTDARPPRGMLPRLARRTQGFVGRSSVLIAKWSPCRTERRKPLNHGAPMAPPVERTRRRFVRRPSPRNRRGSTAGPSPNGRVR